VTIVVTIFSLAENRNSAYKNGAENPTVIADVTRHLEVRALNVRNRLIKSTDFCTTTTTTFPRLT